MDLSQGELTVANYGTTSITITGPQEDRAALRIVLAATADARLGFSLAGVAPDVWRADGLLRNADMVEADDSLRLDVCMAYDHDCLPLAASLSQRFPTLRFEAWFDCEGTWPNFTATVHDAGAEICHAWFETMHLASLATDPADPRCMWAIAFWQRTPERDRAASIFLEDRMDPFVRRPDAVAGWRRSDDDAISAVYLLPDADAAGHLVLALDTVEATGTLLRGVDGCGGYQSAERMSLDDLRSRLPELAVEIGRLVTDTAADRVSYHAWQPIAPPCGQGECEIPF